MNSLSLPFLGGSGVAPGGQVIHVPGAARLQPTKRRGPVVLPGPIAGRCDVLCLDLMPGCGHGCPFCFASSRPAPEAVSYYEGTALELEAELATRRTPVRAVVIGTASDPFPPWAEVQAETARVVGVLASRGIEACLMTRGYIRPEALRVLAVHRQRVRVTVGLLTPDRAVQRILEPGTAPPKLRLRQIRRLRSLGVAVQAALEPLLPGVTDMPAHLAPVFEALAALGIQQVVVGYLVLRPSPEEWFVRLLEAHGWDEAVLGAFADAPVLRWGRMPAARYLPKPRRQRGYAALMALGARWGITVRINAITNPDFQARPAPE